MCTCYVLKPQAFLDYSILENDWKAGNNDGAGYMFAHNNKLIVKKPFWKVDILINHLKADRQHYPNFVFVVHLRLATSGTVNAKNCQPIQINDDIGFVHNGIFWNLESINDTLSDSVVFGKSILGKLPPDFITIPAIITLLDEYCKNHSSKVIILDAKGKSIILNEEDGEWNKGVWQSYKTETSYRGKYTSYQPPANLGKSDLVLYNKANDTAIMSYCDMCHTALPEAELFMSKGGNAFCEYCFRNTSLIRKLMCPACLHRIYLKFDYKNGVKTNICTNCGYILTEMEILSNMDNMIKDREQNAT